MISSVFNTACLASSGLPVLKYLKITPTDGLANKTVFNIELELDTQAEYVFIDFKDGGEWGYTEYFFTHPDNRYTFERIFEKVAVREYRIYAQTDDGKQVSLHSGSLRIKDSGKETGVFEFRSERTGGINNANSDEYDETDKSNEHIEHIQANEYDAGKIGTFSINKVIPECICLQQSAPVSFLVSCSGMEISDIVKYSGELLKQKQKVIGFDLKVENQNTLSFCIDEIGMLEEGVYSLNITSDKGVSGILNSCITIVSQMNVCKFEIGNIVVEADKIVDCIDRPEVKIASGNVRINSQIVCTSDVEINTRYKSVKGDGKLYINCTGYTAEDVQTPFTICDNGSFNISCVTGEIKVEDSEKFAYLAGNKFDVKTYTITKDDGLNIDFKLFGFTDMLRVLVLDTESLKYLPKIKTFSVSANIKDNVFKVVTDVEGKIPCIFKLSGIKFLKFFEFGDLKFKYDSENDVFTSEAAVKIGNSKSKFLPQLPQLQLIGGIAIKDGKVSINKIAGKGTGYNAPIDSTGLFLNSVEISADNMFTKPFTVSLLSQLSGGPKIKVLSKNYSLLTIYDAGIEMNITDLEASLVGKLKLLNFDRALSTCKASISLKNGAAIEGNIDLLVINGKLYMWFKSRDDFGGKINGYFTIPSEVPVIGGTTLSGAEFLIENSKNKGLYAYSNINIWKDITVSAEYYFETNRIKVASNLFNNKLSGSAYTLKEYDSPFFASLYAMPLGYKPSDCKYIDIPSGIGEALIKIDWEGNDSDFNLMLPNGTIVKYEEAQSDSDKLFYLNNLVMKQAAYFLQNPDLGRYCILPERPGCIIRNVELYNINVCPEISYIYADESDSGKILIRCGIKDDDEKHDISLYYDTDNIGYDGELIAGITGTDGAKVQTEWDVSDLIKNNYYIYAKVCDGTNAPVLSYCTDSIYAGGANGLPAPQNLTAYSDGEGIHVNWDDEYNIDTMAYVVQVSVKEQPSKVVKEVVCPITQCLINVQRGLTYLIRVRSMDNDKNVSGLYSEYEVFHIKNPAENVVLDEIPEGIVNNSILRLKGSNSNTVLLCAKLNGNPVCEFCDKMFNVPIELREGVNYVSLECIDDGVEENIYKGKVVLISNPSYITVNGIMQNHTTFEDTINIEGETDGNHVQINGQKINVQNGKFHEAINLVKGNNTIEIAAANAAGFKCVKTFNIIMMDKQELMDKYYSDIEGHWAQDVIERMRARNIMFDKGFKEFAPDSCVSRGETAAFIVNLLCIDEDYKVQPFKDVELTYKFREHIIKAYNNRLIRGYLAEYFPDNNINRQDLCVILFNVLNYCGVQCSESECLPFKDEQDISQYAKQSVNAVYEKGIINGKPGLLFDPAANASRAETAVMLERLIRVIE